MTFVRVKRWKKADGTVREYYYKVHNYWENGKVRQKVVEYLGKSPNKVELPIEPELAAQLAQILMSNKQTPSELKETLKKLGLPVGTGMVKEVSLIFNPPSGSSLFVSFEPSRVFRPEETHCKKCGKSLQILKSHTRNLVTLVGGRTKVKEVWSYCSVHPNTTYRSELLHSLKPPRSLYGWDVLVYVGLKRFGEHKQLNEIQEALTQQYGIHIPLRTIGSLAKRFLEYWVAVHIDSASVIRAVLEKQGTYQILIDGTQEKGSKPLLLVKDALSGIRLWAVQIPAEKEEYITPVLLQVQNNFGKPGAVTRDMGKGIASAADNVFADVHTIICHYHFLRLVGDRLLKRLYITFQKRVDRTGVKGKLRRLQSVLRKCQKKNSQGLQVEKLIEHILSYEKEGEGLGVPFDLPTLTFYKRCIESVNEVHNRVLESARNNRHDVLACRLENIIRALQPPPMVKGRIMKEYEALQQRQRWFTKIRKAFRYRNGPVPLSTIVKHSNKELEKARQGIANILQKIDRQLNKAPSTKHDIPLMRILRGIRSLIAENERHLLAPNVIVGKGKNARIIRLERTNNGLEQDFRQIRRHFRRIQGNSDVEGKVQREGVGMVLVLNFGNQQYMKAIYGSKLGISGRFRKVTKTSLEYARKLMKGSEIAGNSILPQ